MEDTYEMINWTTKTEDCIEKEKISLEDSYAVFAIYDGHGGIEAAEFAKATLPRNITNHTHFIEDPEISLKAAFLQTDSNFTEYAIQQNINGGVGTTATVALICGNNLYVANLGDSEAFLCRKGTAKPLTISHTPDNAAEKQRIANIGGVVISTHSQNRLGHPVWNPNLINIGISRSIGDLYFKKQEFVQDKTSGLIAEPSISKHVLTDEDEFMLLASDGFWDVMSGEEAVQTVLKSNRTDCDSICKDLIEICRARHPSDNVTVLLVKFRKNL
jgi:serine/threonine protein phosphatase PrpC